jgi:O-antigen/teichoic acid export membrane protein
VRLMFVQIGLQLLVGFYQAGLLGLQQHVRLNLISSLAVALRFGGAALVLFLVSPTLDALFAWLIIATAIQAAMLAAAVNQSQPPGIPAFDFRQVRKIWRYATGLTGVAVLSLVLTQIDKLILSRTLSLADFGLYALACAIATAPSKPLGPLARTLLPRMTQLLAQGNTVDLARLYHLGCQIASVLIMPVTAVVALFAPEIMAVIFQRSDEASAAAPLVGILVVGFGGFGLMVVPYMLTLAYGWVKFGFYQNVLACLLLVPLVFVLAAKYGALGGAMAWTTLSLGYVFLSPYFVHQHVLTGNYRDWALRDTLPAAVASALTALILRQIVQFGNVWFVNLTVLTLTFFAAQAAAMMALDLVRPRAFGIVRLAYRRLGVR